MQHTSNFEPARSTAVVDVVVAVRAEWLRLQVERALLPLDTVRTVRRPPGIDLALRAESCVDSDVLVLSLDEIDTAAGDRLERVLEDGLPVLAIIDENTVDLAAISRVRGAGFLSVFGITSNTLRHALGGVLDGDPPVPRKLVHRLMAPSRTAAEHRRPPRLTPREQQALVLLVDGLSNKQLARRMQISPHGAKRLVGNILAKLNSPNRTQAVARAIREGHYDDCVGTVREASGAGTSDLRNAVRDRPSPGR